MPLTTPLRRRGVAALALPSLLLAACSGSGGSPSGPSATPTPSTPDVVAHLDNLPQGTARVDVDARTHRLVAHLNVTGLAANVAHAVQLHRGSCLQRGGELVTAFADGVSGAGGALVADLQATSSVATIPAGVYVEIHLVGAAQLGSAVDPQSIPIACSDISATAPAAAVRISGTPGYKPFGAASLSYSSASRSAKLALNLQAFVGGSVHGMQILSGTCAAPGATVHALTDVTTDARGTVTSTQSISGFDVPPPASGWILMIRSGPGAATGPQAQPLLCGPFAKPA
ncbi:MAG TPA: hypothetical protein VN193_02330 [Candidatus Angelobacter sp.]|nr:hypothetical protein [Candidatus Angelobacter sp.]